MWLVMPALVLAGWFVVIIVIVLLWRVNNSNLKVLAYVRALVPSVIKVATLLWWATDRPVGYRPRHPASW